MNYLILGGTGTTGSEVVRALLNRGERYVRVLTRSEDKANKLPEGVRPVFGDLNDPRTYNEIFKDSDTIFLLISNSASELFEGLATVNEVHKRGYKKIVYLSVHKADVYPIVPHFIGKAAIETAIRQTGIPHVILRPNNFYQNDFWFKEGIVAHGIYGQPLGDKGVSRVDVRDIADAAVNAFTSDRFDGKIYPLVGPEPITGQQCAELCSRLLGKDVKYVGNDTEAWYQNAVQAFPAWLAYEFMVMYQKFIDDGLIAGPDEVRQCEEIVGHPMRPYEDYVKELLGVGEKVKR